MGFPFQGGKAYANLGHDKRGRNLPYNKQDALNNGLCLASIKQVASHSTKINDNIDHIVLELLAMNRKL